MHTLKRNYKFWLSCFVLLIASSGCQQATLFLKTKPPNIETIDSLPLSVAVIYDESITNYTHEESFPQSRNWVIHVSDKQKQIMTKAFSALFDELLILDSADLPADVDLVLAPRLEDFQFTTPKQNGKNQFEAWLQYNIKLLNAEGSLLSEWPLAAYGSVVATKSSRPHYFMSLAINRAMRDAMAQLLVELPSLPVVSKSLAK